MQSVAKPPSLEDIFAMSAPDLVDNFDCSYSIISTNSLDNKFKGQEDKWRLCTMSATLAGLDLQTITMIVTDDLRPLWHHLLTNYVDDVRIRFTTFTPTGDKALESSGRYRMNSKPTWSVGCERASSGPQLIRFTIALTKLGDS